MSVRVLYATVEGQTGKIARVVQDKIAAIGQEVRTVDIGAALADVDFAGVDHVVLAASVHERRHPQTFEIFVQANRDALAACKTLMLSVSLKAAFADGRDEAREYVEEMSLRTGFAADRSVCVAGAVRSGAYGYFETEVLRHVVLDGQDVRPEDGPHEFTDWDALAKVVQDFIADA